NAIAYTSQVIWARLESTGCFGYDLVSFTISILPVPAFNNPNALSLDLKQCDADGTDDNSTLFDLTQHAAMLTGNQAGVTISYFLSTDDASTGNNPITAPQAYANISSPQTIFMRMQNNVTGCLTISSFDIEITKIIAGEPLDISLCDTNLSGVQEFDLAQNNVLILNGNTDASITYYRSESDAEAENNPIGPIYQNETAYSNQVIWARLESTSGCFGYDIKSFSIIVNPLPVFNNPSSAFLKLEKCDSDGVDDQSTDFDLTQHEMLFIGNQAGMQFSYHITSADAVSGTDEILLPNVYANISNPQVIHVRMTNSTTGCFAVSQFEIEIINPVTAGDPVNLALCDFDQNGLQNFNLAANDDAVKNGIPGTKVTYFASLLDAENNANPIPDVYPNAQPYQAQTIWARLENITGCFGFDVKSFTISILPIPTVNFALEIKDFTRDENSIAIIIPNADLFEFALNESGFSDSTFFNGLNPGLYTVHIRSKDGCMETSRETAILNYPKFFTPNGDTYNDFWRIPFLSFFPDAHITIFDRYGKVITAF
ncbi:MAG: T9SS type B sorting domain-containing protein, partial [Flavobacterium sp.]